MFDLAESEKHPSGLKPVRIPLQSARLKSCPFKTGLNLSFFATCSTAAIVFLQSVRTIFRAPSFRQFHRRKDGKPHTQPATENSLSLSHPLSITLSPTDRILVSQPTMRRFRLIFALLFLLPAALPLVAASSSADLPHVHVQLVMPEKVLVAGTSTDVGLYFKLEPGWHIYWKNAGDAGEPPKIPGHFPQAPLRARCSFQRPSACRLARSWILATRTR